MVGKFTEKNGTKNGSLGYTVIQRLREAVQFHYLTPVGKIVWNLCSKFVFEQQDKKIEVYQNGNI